MNRLLSIWLSTVHKANTRGIPVPTLTDPKSGRGSVTFSLVVLSSGLCTLCVLVLLGTAISKLTGWFSITDANLQNVKSAFDSSFQFMLASLAAYVGRKFQADGKKVEVGEVQDESKS